MRKRRQKEKIKSEEEASPTKGFPRPLCVRKEKPLPGENPGQQKDQCTPGDKTTRVREHAFRLDGG